MAFSITATLIYVLGPFIDYMATNHRALCMLLVVCPLSFVLRTVLGLRDWVVFMLTGKTTPKEHAAKVAKVVAAVQQRNALPDGQRKMMCTARAPWQNLSTRFADYKVWPRQPWSLTRKPDILSQANSNCIYVGDLRGIIKLDPEKRTVHIEPLVTVGDITRTLVPQGWMLATTLEIDEATVGGLAMAVGMTTASHKYGLLQETVQEYEATGIRHERNLPNPATLPLGRLYLAMAPW